MAKTTDKPKATFNLERLHKLRPCEDDPAFVECTLRIPRDQIKLARTKDGVIQPYYNTPYIVRGTWGGIENAAMLKGGRLLLFAAPSDEHKPTSTTEADPLVKYDE